MPHPRLAPLSSRSISRRAPATPLGARRLFRVSNPWLPPHTPIVARSEAHVRRLVGRIWPGEPVIVER